MMGPDVPAPGGVMARLEPFSDIIKRHEPLAPYTYLRLGGPAEMLVQPRSPEELSAVVRACSREPPPLRVRGSGCTRLTRDEGVPGAGGRRSAPPSPDTRGEAPRVKPATGAPVSALISRAARHNLAGLE